MRVGGVENCRKISQSEGNGRMQVPYWLSSSRCQGKGSMVGNGRQRPVVLLSNMQQSQL